MEKVLTINNDIREKIENTLLIDGFLKEEIAKIENEKYMSFNSNDEIKSKMLSIFNNKDFFDVLNAISDGYSYGEMVSVLLIKKSRLDEFVNYISSVDLDIDEVRSLIKYNNNSTIFLSRKVGISKEIIYKSIIDNFYKTMNNLSIDKEVIFKIKSFITSLDFSLPLYKNYNRTINYLESLKVNNDNYILNIVDSLDSFYNIDKLLIDLGNALNITIDSSIVTYRCINEKLFFEDNKNIDDLLGQKISINYYSSTSLLYPKDKIKDGNIVLEMFLPYGTKGIYLNPFSIDNNQKEMLLNENDIYIVDIDKNYIDKNGNRIFLLKSLVLSKDKENYKNFLRDIHDNYYDIRDEINKIIETVMNNEIIISNFEIIDENKKCNYSLKSYISDQTEKFLYKRQFDYDKNFEDEFLEPCIIDFSRRTKIDNITINSINNEKSNICLFGRNRAIMNIENIDNSFANQIKNITPKIHADIYIEKQEQINNVRKSGNPLKMISARAYAGYTSLLFITTIVLIIAIIAIIVMTLIG